jgi:hypothetical protein
VEAICHLGEVPNGQPRHRHRNYLPYSLSYASETDHEIIHRLIRGTARLCSAWTADFVRWARQNNPDFVEPVFGLRQRTSQDQPRNKELSRLAPGKFPGATRKQKTLNSLKNMSLGTILLVVLILMLIGAFPSWPHSKSWGYGPSGGLGLVVVILLILVLTGRI